MNEAETRAEHIDPALKAAGWGVVEGSKILREYPITPGRIEGHGRRGKPLTADYVLVYRNRKLAVVEAKALDEELASRRGRWLGFVTHGMNSRTGAADERVNNPYKLGEPDEPFGISEWLRCAVCRCRERAR